MPARSLAFALTLGLTLGLLPACGGQDAAEESAATDEQTAGAAIDRSGVDGGMFYSCQSSGAGSAVFTPDGGNGYGVSWSNIGYLFCGKGWNPGSTRTVTWSGSYTNSGGGAFGLYGWTTQPLVEYYIVEKAGAAGSPAAGTLMGSYVTDGSTYLVYRHQQVNQPSVIGVATFYRYIAVRQTPRTSGVITVRNHFEAWARLGMRLGTLGYQLVLTEAWNGTGSARVKIGACCATGGGGITPL